MNNWYQGIVVNHKEIDNKMWHCFDDENFEILVNERKEQLKEIERLQNKNEELLTLYTTEREVKEDYKSIIKEVREYCENNKEFTQRLEDVLEILDKLNKE